MINSFYYIGKAVLENDGLDKITDPTEKRASFLFHQSIRPRPNIDGENKTILDNRAICLDFDLTNDSFEFKLSSLELDDDNRKDLFAFKLAAPGDKKKFFMTNNISTFYSSLFKQSIEYIKDKRNNKKCSKWFNANIYSCYDDFLKLILYKYYVIDNDNTHLNAEKLCKTQKDLYDSIFKDYNGKKHDEIWNRFLNKHFLGRDSMDTTIFPGIFLVTFNEKTILEYDSAKYRSSYINLCYYDLFGRFFQENSIKNILCHMCKESNDAIQEVPFPIKFYGITNNLFFEMLSKSNAYKSFSICNKCLSYLLTGMKYVSNYLNYNLFGIQAYIIPYDIVSQNNVSELGIYEAIINLLRRSNRIYKNDLMKINNILRKSKRRSLFFHLLFYFSPAGSQQFDILKIISNIDLNSLITKLEIFDKYTEDYYLNRLETKIGDNSLCINDIRNYLFPSFYSESKVPDFKVYGKDLLNFLETFLNNNRFSYNSLIRSFVTIFYRRLNKKKHDYLSPMKMMIVLTIFKKLNQLSGGFAMDKGNSVSEILNEDYRKFFETHSEIYKDNAYRQGLFLLGTIISRIKYAQKDKNLTFLRKVNMSGIPPRRVPGLINHVREFANIYKKNIFEEKGIWGNIYDRLQGIEESGMKPDEIVFYILTGISYSDYLGQRKGLEKKLEDNKGEKNDNC